MYPNINPFELPQLVGASSRSAPDSLPALLSVCLPTKLPCTLYISCQVHMKSLAPRGWQAGGRVAPFALGQSTRSFNRQLQAVYKWSISITNHKHWPQSCITTQRRQGLTWPSNTGLTAASPVVWEQCMSSEQLLVGGMPWAPQCNPPAMPLSSPRCQSCRLSPSAPADRLPALPCFFKEASRLPHPHHCVGLPHV